MPHQPIIVMPRRADLKEHRSDHQMATVKQLAGQGRVIAAWDETELLVQLENLDELSDVGKISPYASEPLLKQIRNFIDFGSAKAKISGELGAIQTR